MGNRRLNYICLPNLPLVRDASRVSYHDFPLSGADVHRHSQAYVTMGIIDIDAVVFLYELTLGDLGQTRFYYK